MGSVHHALPDDFPAFVHYLARRCHGPASTCCLCRYAAGSIHVDVHISYARASPYLVCKGNAGILKPSTPNGFQKFTHRILMLRPVSAFLAVILHHVDAVALKLTKGRHTVTEIVGLP